MLKIKGTRMMACMIVLASWFPHSNIYAQTSTVQNSTNSTEAAPKAAPGLSGQSSMGMAVRTVPPNNTGLKGFAAYADRRSDLTPDQARISFELAVKDGDRALALKLIKQTHDSLYFLLWKDTQVTPLAMAAATGDVEMVAAILAKGIPVDSVELVGQTALVSAARGAYNGYHQYPSSNPPERYIETIEMLLKAGANIKAKDSEHGWTSLANLISQPPFDPVDKKYYLAVVKTLLDHGADPSEVPTHFFAGGGVGADEITQLFVDHGLSPKAKDLALAQAVRDRKPDRVRQLLAQGADPNARALGGTGSVIDAAGDELAKMLLEAGANPNSTGNGGPSIFRLTSSDPDLLRMMIAKGANPNAQDAQGQTALGLALSHRTFRQQGITKLCIGGPTNCIDPPGDNFDRVKVTKLLLDAGADPNKRSKDALPLTQVEDSEHKIITLLLDKGAHMENLSIEGEKIGPISQAIASHKYFLAEELLRHTKDKLRADEKWALYSAAQGGKLELAEALVQHGINLDERGPLGETALHFATHSGNAAMVKRLLSLGANPNAQIDAMPQSSNVGSIPSVLWIVQMETMQKVYEEKRKIYTAAGLQPPDFTDGQVTPLMFAVISDDIDVAKALLDGGAKTSIKSQHGLSAPDIAHQMGNQTMERLLEGR